MLKNRYLKQNIHCYQRRYLDNRAEIVGVIYPDMIDDQLKYLLFHEAKVHNKKLVILDKEFMIQLLDKYLTDKNL